MWELGINEEQVMDNYLFLMKKCVCKDDFQISIHKKNKNLTFSIGERSKLKIVFSSSFSFLIKIFL